MSTQRDGGPAFPGGVMEGYTQRPNSGMSLRDWFAGQALAGFVGNDSFMLTLADEQPSAKKAAALVSEGAYIYADAMLAAREVRS